MSKPPPYLDADFDPRKVDFKALAAELEELRAELDADVGPDDIAHLKKIERWGKVCTLLGYGTAWMAPNPLSSMLISQGLLTRWLVMHHVSHRGYDKVPGIEPKYTSKVFGKGWRRLVDWMDWIYPEAWHEEHDFLHHYHLGEDDDPDLVERNTEWMRELDLPDWVEKLFVGLLAGTWKWAYYAPSTMRELQDARARRDKKEEPEDAGLFNPLKARGREVWLKCLLPHAAWRFAAIPALFAPLGPVAVANVFLNSVGAELITNVHSFLIIGPNHTGDDLYRFDESIDSREEFYLRQIVGSANYSCGTELVDWMQMWLNYQIEHHIWPDLTMLQYRKVQPKVKALCERFGVPYVQESVFTRAKKMVDVIVGKTSMRRVDGLA
ncbi:MAG: fatty acid desaturase family protein [Persicimonas sp.]